MQQHTGHLEEELKKTKDQLYVTEKERDRALDEVKEMKKVAGEANMRQKVREMQMELNSVKDALSIASQELNIKENNMIPLKLELEKAKKLELKLAERDALLGKLKGELSSVKVSEANVIALLSDRNIRIQELEEEIKKGEELNSKTFDSLVVQTKQLEQTKILLEEAKLEIASLHERMKKLEGEKMDSLKVKTLREEMEMLKNELKLVTEAEENGKKAMDDLALALKEVATEASQAKEKLSVSQAELDCIKDEGENLKVMLKSKEEMYKELLDEAKKEAERYKNTAERLRLEAEESLLAWNEKETGFVDCIKKAEEERFAEQGETSRLLELLTAAERKAMASKEENQKLRDILKQALNEANVAKEAAGIAKAENSQLKDSLAEKEDALNFLTRENEHLRINDAAAFENIKELKRLLSEALTKEFRKEDKEKSPTKEFKKEDKEHKDGNKMGKAFSFRLKELKLPNKHRNVDEDPENDEALTSSIFGTLASSDSAAHQRKNPSSVFRDGGETLHPDGTHFDDPDNDKGSRKKRALLRRFGDLIRRSHLQRKEPLI
ncbi:WEB family protein At4g27595, chloroplastic [Alnus glutinosa]|uniref:WEB family protein At4g27595, chloroplastic n=1 Tax=Alnus glutinosa TaxID=3517 RepID=UPI002D772F38|nr:WEB family protein At4g27595, chloroplastic [Alnus glutinosa]